MSSKPILIILMIGVCCTACAPLVPLHQENRQLPNPLAVLETPDAIINMQHLTNQYGHYVFDLEIINKTNTVLSFSPTQVKYYASSKMFSIPTVNENVHIKSSLNSLLSNQFLLAKSPQAMEARFIARERNLAKTQAFFYILSMGLMIYDGAKDIKDIHKERWTNSDANRAVVRDASIAATILATDLTGLLSAQAQQDRYYAQFELLSDEAINPLTTKRGKIFLPKEASYRYLRLVIPLGSIDYVIDFKRQTAKGR